MNTNILVRKKLNEILTDTSLKIEDFYLLGKLISAELFRFFNYCDQKLLKFYFGMSLDEEKGFITVFIRMDEMLGSSLNLFMFRPFIDVAAHLKINLNGSIVISKSYKYR